MAIDPDMEPIIAELQGQIDVLKQQIGNLDASALEVRIGVLEERKIDDSWLRYTQRISTLLIPMTDDERIAWLDAQAI